MAVTALLGKPPWVWRVALVAVPALAVAVSFGVGLKKGYDAGYARARAKGDAALAARDRDYADRRAEILRRNADKLRREAERALDAGAELARAKEEHAAIQHALHARIAVAARGGVHRFSPDFVRLFNEAVGAGTGSSRETACAAGTAALAGSGVAAGTRVRQRDGVGNGNKGKLSSGTAPERFRAAGGARGAAEMDAASGTGSRPGHRDEPGAFLPGPASKQTVLVSERDVLAYIVYYGKRCRDMEAQLRALIRLVGETE
ncbi:MAG: hypothetical protein LIP28_06820 [Deltaproteobacteria bacterium]|nr:hypothetical protein [Deltaproteobacteria bacterium]